MCFMYFIYKVILDEFKLLLNIIIYSNNIINKYLGSYNTSIHQIKI